jgi:hypothetical protein
MPVMPPGYDAKAGFFGGPLYRERPGIRGRPEQKTNIRTTPGNPLELTVVR